MGWWEKAESPARGWSWGLGGALFWAGGSHHPGFHGPAEPDHTLPP